MLCRVPVAGTSDQAADANPDRLVGRENELAQLDAWLDGVVAGRSRPLLLEGEPGIGKTTLLNAARAHARARGMATVAVTAIPSAVNLALSGLGAVVGPLGAKPADVDPNAIAPLQLALSDPSANVNPLALCGGLVALLASAAEHQPIVIIIDDGQWLDVSSVDVIVAAFRGLVLDQVGLLVAARSDEPHSFPDLQRLPVLGLSEAAASELFVELKVDPTVLTFCWEASAGNPLALDVLLRRLDDHERRGTRPLPDPLPVADAITNAFRRRLDALPDATRIALIVLAADTASSATSVEAAIVRMGGALLDFEPAEDAGVVVRRSGRRTFAHPLLRATALALGPASRLRAAHTALAAAHADVGEFEQRAWQLAAAAIGPDDAAADALAEVAAAAQRRGAIAVAAEGYLTAARLSSGQSDRVARLLLAGDTLWVVGRVTEAMTVLHEAIEAAATDHERAEAAVLLHKMELWARGPRFARDRLLVAAEPLELTDPNQASKLLSHAAATAIVSCDVVGTLAIGRRAFELATPDDPTAVIQATVALGFVESHAADPGAAARLAPIVELAEMIVDTDDPEVAVLLGIVGMFLTEAERLEEAQRFLLAVVRRSRREGSAASEAMVAAILAEKHWRTGDWLEAWHLMANDVVAGATMRVNEAWTAALLAHLDAGFGRAESCRQRCAEATRGGTATGAAVVLVWAGHAMGLLEVGLGRWSEAARHLDKVASLTESLGRHIPGAVWWQGDHIEALVRAGRLDDATKALDRLDAERAIGDQHWPACVAARARGLMSGDVDVAVKEFTVSIEEAELIPAPFEVARSHLNRGECLLENGSTLEAMDDLKLAVEIFDRLGAAAFAERTRVLLGEPVAARSTAVLTDLLTPAELRVALAVAGGATNREVATDLFVSIKTVDYHLQNVYRKLSLRSRTELAVRVSQAGAA
ncbi:MAG: hypothetical protein QOD92_3139 [Acidimicrobiaceae bacterium]|jgi:DNA-binding NarL/FixJ family response regulator